MITNKVHVLRDVYYIDSLYWQPMKKAAESKKHAKRNPKKNV